MKPTTGTIVRVVLLIIALVNMALATLGIVPEEIVGNEQAYKIGSYVITVAMSLITAWKNNSFTGAAILADQYMAALKGQGSGKESDAESDET
jgi:SPP1 family holin